MIGCSNAPIAHLDGVTLGNDLAANPDLLVKS